MDDGEHEQHLQLMEAAEHLYLCAEKSYEAEKQESNDREGLDGRRFCFTEKGVNF